MNVEIMKKYKTEAALGEAMLRAVMPDGTPFKIDGVKLRPAIARVMAVAPFTGLEQGAYLLGLKAQTVSLHVRAAVADGFMRRELPTGSFVPGSLTVYFLTELGEDALEQYEEYKSGAEK